MSTEIWIISLPLSDFILYLRIIHPQNFRKAFIIIISKIIANTYFIHKVCVSSSSYL